MTNVVGPFSLARVVNAVEKVRQRLLKAAAALEASGCSPSACANCLMRPWDERALSHRGE
jgi:hypothetical protein